MESEYINVVIVVRLFKCILQDGSFVPLVLEGKTIHTYPGHTCLTTREVSVCCVDENGTLKVLVNALCSTVIQ